jgi:hypothetical protein
MDRYIRWLKNLYTSPDDDILEKYGARKGIVDFNKLEECITALMPAESSYASKQLCMNEIKEKRILRIMLLRRLGLLTESTGEL